MDVSQDAARAAILRAVSEEPQIEAAYLFGSVARGTAGPLSDLDVGLLLPPGLDAEAVCDRVLERVAAELRTGKIDVVALRDAPLPLRYRVVSEGVVLFSRNRAAAERFFVESVLHYLDFKVLRDRAFATQSAAIRRGA